MPTLTSAQARGPAVQGPTAPAPTPVSVTPPLPISGLVDQVTNLTQQLAGLRAQRTILQRQINRSTDGATRAALELKQVPIESQIAQTELDLAGVRAQLISRQGQTGQLPPFFPPQPRRQMDPDLIAGMMFAFIFAVMMPIAFAYARRIWRGKPKDTAPRLDDVVVPRLDRLEQAVDAIAIEIERISESQRFVTRVLVERPAPVHAPAAPQKEAAAVADATPFLALGAGPAEPIRAAERQAMKQSITPH